MKVYSCPKEVPAPIPDYSHYDHKKEIAAEDKHQSDLAKWLKERGYTGKYTGEIFRVGVADGYAQYMLADGPTAANSFLVHLPYGDAYNSRDVQFLPKKEVIARIKSAMKFNAMWQKTG